MTVKQFSTASPMPLTAIDWQRLAREAFGQGFVAGFIGGTLQTVAKMVDEKHGVQIEEPAASGADDDDAIEAAALLGVSVDASDTEIRAALRARFSSSGLHPDHGGDGVEAARLIAAKNLLIERLRSEP
jgi:hypothetical protein